VFSNEQERLRGDAQKLQSRRSAHAQFHITHTQTRISMLQKTAAAENVVQRQHITATVLDIMRSVLTSEQAKHRSLHRFHVNLK